MWTAITTIASKSLGLVTGSLGGIWGYVAVAVVAGSLAGWGAHKVTYDADLGKYQALQLKDAKTVTDSLEAQAAALTAVATQQHALDTEVAQGAVAEAQAQNKIVTHTITVTQEIPVHVHDATAPSTPVPLACIPYGLVRVLDAAALSNDLRPVSAGDLALPAGKSDDDCAPIKATDLADSVAGNYSVAAQNAEQLNALIAKTKELVNTANEDITP